MRVSPETDSPVLSVSELNQFARGALEMHVGKVWVSGEISNFSAPASGHWYFTLKDDNAQISCAMFRGKNQFIRTRLKPGMQILVNGKVSLYEGRGSYQLIADYLEESGVGAMARAVEALKAKLLQEGLFDQSRKKPLPRVLQHIAVITSDTGAAIHDIISVLAERFPQLNITLIAAQVQGDAAPVSLQTALDRAQRYHAEVPIDAVIIGRGGGSAEDLAAFNRESLVRAVAAFPLPIISAVGHEVDTTLCDLVADVRAPTPSAAAEMISPDQEQLQQNLDYSYQRLCQSMRNRLSSAQQQLKLKQANLQHPLQTLQVFQQQFAHLARQLSQALLHNVESNQHRLAQLQLRLQQQSPAATIQQHQAFNLQLQNRLKQSMLVQLQAAKQQLAASASQLEIVSPLATLSRGYSIVKDQQQQIIADSNQLNVDDEVQVQLHKGSFVAKVAKIKSK